MSEDYAELAPPPYGDDQEFEDLNRPSGPEADNLGYFDQDSDLDTEIDFPDDEFNDHDDFGPESNHPNTSRATDSVSGVGNVYPELEPGPSRASTNRSRTSRTPHSSNSDQQRFVRTHYRNMPELAEHFRCVQIGPNRKGNYCIYCKKTLRSHTTNRMVEHLADICEFVPKGVKERYATIKNSDTQDDFAGRDIMNRRFAQIMIMNGIPMKLLDCRLFKRFMKDYCNGRQLASREQMMAIHIPNITRKTEKKFCEKVENSADYSLSIEFDHWTDLNHRSLLGVVATFPDTTRHLIELADVSAIGHASDEVVRSLKNALEKIPSKKINAIISDGAANCVLARTKMISETPFKHLISQRCLAHWLNLIGEELCRKSSAHIAIVECNKLVNLLANDTKILALIREAGAKRCTRAMPTRWYTTVTMFESLLDVRSIALGIMESPSTTIIAESTKAECLKLLRCSDLWPNVEAIVRILRPLVDCIAESEARSGTVGRVMRHILEFAKKILTSDWDDEYNFSAIESFLTYFSQDKLEKEMGLMLAAYYFDPANMTNYITPEGEEFVLDGLSRLARATGYRSHRITTDLVADLQKFSSREGSFSRAIGAGESAEDWWKSRPEGALKPLALRLACIRSSSANVERAFSTLKYIQSPGRLNYRLDNLINIAKVRIANFVDADDIIDESGIITTAEESRPGFRFPFMKTVDRLLPNRRLTRASSSQPQIFRPKPQMFRHVKIRKSYDFFKKIIDFKISKNFEDGPGDMTLDLPESEVLALARANLRKK